MILKIREKAQSIMEYVILLAIVSMALGGMKMYMLRSVKAKFKLVQDQLADEYKDYEIDQTNQEGDKKPSYP